MSEPIDIAELQAGILAGDRPSLSRAVTLIESTASGDRTSAIELLEYCLGHTPSNTFRIGITGVPGVGKSSLIDQLGLLYTNEGSKLAVLAIDPSSSRSKGSILGDKTRMEELSAEPLAFIRPSPTSGTLGGVARRTKETIMLCEAAGHSHTLIETVGVGQSELAVDSMTDMTVLLVLAGAGDELQGIKRGIMEAADLVVITKVDGDNIQQGKKARQELLNAIALMPARAHGQRPAVLTCSALDGSGIVALKQAIDSFNDNVSSSGNKSKKRNEQAIYWQRSIAEDLLLEQFRSDERVERTLGHKKNNPDSSPYAAALEAVRLFRSKD